MFKRLRYNIRAIKERDPASRNKFEIFLLYPGLHAINFHRLSHFLYNKHLYFLSRLISNISRFLTQIEIHPGAKIGWGVFIDHGGGVVIGETAVIGDDCTIYQGTTLGGTGKEHGKRHPTLGKNVMVGSGAKILGPFKVGDNAIVAAGAVVLKEVPSNATAVGVPARIVKVKGKRVSNASLELNQTNIPNPVENEIQKLKAKMKKMEIMLNEIKDDKEVD